MSKGMQEQYKELLDYNPNAKEVDFEKIFNQLFKNDGDIDQKTDLHAAYPLTTMDTLSVYYRKKYGKNMDLCCMIIECWSKKFKGQSVSVNGKRVTQVLDSIKGFINTLRQRSLGDRLLGSNYNSNGESNTQ